MRAFRNFIIVFVVSAAVIGALFPAITRAAAEPLEINFFWREGCPHCAKEEPFLDTLEQEYGSQIHINRYEIQSSTENRDLFIKFIKDSGQSITGVPATFIRDEVVVGFNTESDTGSRIRGIIDQCLEEMKCEQENPLLVTLPIVGQVDLSRFSIVGMTAVVAAIDGFNPCAMWVLIILISMMLPMKNRRRMWLLGLTFIGASAFIYFVFLAAWLEFFHFIGMVRFVQVLIGVCALGVGAYYIRRFTKMKPGECEATNVEQRRSITERIKKAVQTRALWLAIPAIIVVAFIVNLIELACSVGLPAIFTQVLALNNLSRFQYYLYLALYVIIFMLDDMIVFAIAMVTAKAVGTSGKYSRYATLIGGIVILLLGIVLVFKPGWLALVG
ncbi:MAG: thioredoxin family protein [Patescibacteria group bacterium]|nr:thioredoxin family protein [Patescibacteria group bacterium]MDD5715758.1 thioredoxin family protein [Patescibacteria group bacterium]